MNTFLIQGGRRLRGRIPVRGAKNSALKSIAASVLFKDTLRIQNVPIIEDVHRMNDLLLSIGVSVSRQGSRTFNYNSKTLASSILDPVISERIRASIVLTGPLLARLGRVEFPYPGGCVIGKRPIDIFLRGFEKMGATVKQQGKKFTVRARSGGLRGCDLYMAKQSVTATETFMMTATLARGVTRIKNAALEPEIGLLGDFLNRCGGRVTGAGTSTITIRGNGLLNSRGQPFIVPPDRIEAGSFLILAALCGDDVTVTHCEPAHLDAVIDLLRSAGVRLDVNSHSIRVRATARKEYTAVDLKTHEYPGFPTDLQAPAVVFLTQVRGSSEVFETIFDGRLGYVDDLVRMGARVLIMDPHRMLVRGPARLRGRELESPDLRAGLAFVIAAGVAHGRSRVHNIYNIDRGYETIDARLSAIGFSIRREV